MDEFGGMEDFDDLMDAIHARNETYHGSGINHTSDEHEWFKKSNPSAGFQGMAIIIFSRSAKQLDSFFSGSAWKYIKERNQYALHLFSEKQMDLNRRKQFGKILST